MTGNGSHPASWSTTSGTSTMEIDEAITHLPEGTPHVVAGQIHDQDNASPCKASNYGEVVIYGLTVSHQN